MSFALIFPEIFFFNLVSYSGCPELVKSTIFPSTADDTDKQYVCVTLEVKLPEEYPDCEPVVQLRNPRGLDDTTLNHLYRAIKDKCNEFVGQPVIYELIEVCPSTHLKTKYNFLLFTADT